MTAVVSYLPDCPAAKLWELLRRNPKFRADVDGLTRLRTETESPNRKTRLRGLEQGLKFLHEVQSRNEFAHLALQWLEPQPIFIEEHRVRRNESEARTRGVIRWRTVRLGFGITPDTGHESWQWFRTKPGPLGSTEAQANHAGWPTRWGPRVVRRLVRGSKRDAHSLDPIAEWADWFARRTFTVDSAWPETPPGFRRDWECLWRRCSGTGQKARLTNFNRGWSPSEIVVRARQEIREANRYIQGLVGDLDSDRPDSAGTTAPATPTRGGGRLRQYGKFRLNLSTAEEEALIQFDLTQQWQLVELPVLLSRKAARQTLRALESEIIKGLPKVHELLGTRCAWETYLSVEPFRKGGADDLGKAMGLFFRSRVRTRHLSGSGVSSRSVARWLDEGALRPLPSHATEAEAAERRAVEAAVSRAATEERQRNRQLEGRVRFLDDLSAATYPAFDAKQLGEKSPHRGLSGGERSQRKPKEE